MKKEIYITQHCTSPILQLKIVLHNKKIVRCINKSWDNDKMDYDSEMTIHYCYLWQHGLISKHNKTTLHSTLQKENYSVPCSDQATPFHLLSSHLELAHIKVTASIPSQVSGQLSPYSWLLCSTWNGLHAFFSETLSFLDSRILSWFTASLLARFLGVPSLSSSLSLPPLSELY